MKIGDTVFAVVDANNKIVNTAESTLIADDVQSLKYEMEAWRISKEETKIKKVRLVEVEE